jgi:lipid A disaccharide synthetase
MQSFSSIGPSSIFDSRLALHRRGLKVIYYISPQLWAWRPRRVSNIKRDVDLLLSILPFEAEWYEIVAWSTSSLWVIRCQAK